VVKGLAKVLAGPVDIAVVDKENLLLPTPLPREGGDVLAHQLEISLAEGDSVDGTRDHVEDAAVVCSAGQNAPDATKGLERRIIGMQGHLDVVLFGDRDHRFQEVLQIAPDARFGDLAPFGQALGLRSGRIGVPANWTPLRA